MGGGGRRREERELAMREVEGERGSERWSWGEEEEYIISGCDQRECGAASSTNRKLSKRDQKGARRKRIRRLGTSKVSKRSPFVLVASFWGLREREQGNKGTREQGKRG